MTAEQDSDLNIDLNEETLEASESLDSDELGERVGDDGYDAPEKATPRFGTTAEEEREGETLDQKLAEERPDLSLADDTVAPVAARSDSELDETVDERIAEEPSVDSDLDSGDLADGDGVLSSEEVADVVGDEPVVVETDPTAPDAVHPA